MEYYIIEGGRRLNGEVSITGAKNAVLGLIPASILCGCASKIENVPDIRDVQKYLDILEKLGVEVYREQDNLYLNTENIESSDCSPYEEEIGKMRASYYLLGALLGRFGKAVVPLPGGCSIGDRPIDQHIKGFEALGATVKIRHGMVYVEAEKLTGARIYMDVVSVGATINIILAAVLAEGVTYIENAAKEPHVVDVANYRGKRREDLAGDR